MTRVVTAQGKESRLKSKVTAVEEKLGREVVKKQ